MWFERYMLLTTALYRDYLCRPGALRSERLGVDALRRHDGRVLRPFLLFVRFLPMISAFEVKEALFEDREARRRPVAPVPAARRSGGRGSWLKRARPCPFALLAEFASPSALLKAAERAARGLPRHRCLHAVPDRRPCRGDRLPGKPGTALDPRRRPHRSASAATPCRSIQTSITR